jgi:hypothetical protein
MGRLSRVFGSPACAAALSVLATLGACGTISTGPAAQGAPDMRSDDPLARPTQVAWTSARATRCGFIFDPAQFRARYLAAESAYGHTPLQMQKIAEAYDYSRESVLITINDDPKYCSKARVDEIRKDLNRHLAGDYRAMAR